MAEVDKIKKKVYHLLNKTTESGCTEEEAMLAAQKAGELMDHYQLKMSDIEIREQKCVEMRVDCGSRSRGPLDKCAVALARYCDVKIWFDSAKLRRGYNRYLAKEDRKNSNYGVFGLEADCQLFEYLLNVIRKAVEKEAAAFRKTDDYELAWSKKTATNTFKRYMCITISNRLKEMKENRQRDVETTGRNLVLLKDAMIEDEWEKAGIKLTKHKRRSTVRYDGYAAVAGSTAGKSVNLNPGVGGTRSHKAIT